ncbi:MAG: DUF4105 domain-containing protein [Longimicrobiales bacterium]
MRRTVRILIPLLGLLLVIAGAALARGAPSNDRSWAADQARLPDIRFAGDSVFVAGVRDFDHRGQGTPAIRYRDERFHIDDVERVWFALAPFANRYRGLAHTFLSFELADGRHLAVSVEARREKDESYGLVGGIFRAFELTYVIGTEEDLLGVRALRGDTLFLYPARATPAQSRDLLVDMLRRADATQREPEYYHTLFNNCNTNLRDHVNRATPAELPWGWGILLPGFSDELALREGLLDTDLDLEAARARFRVDHHAREALQEGSPDFSAVIRERAAGG